MSALPTLCFLFACIFGGLFWIKQSARLLPIRIALSLGVVLQLWGIIQHPHANIQNALALIAALLACIHLYHSNKKFEVMGFVLAGVTSLLSFGSAIGSHPGRPPSTILSVHILASTIAFAALSWGCIASFFYLFQEKRLKSKQPLLGSVALETLDQIAHQSLVFSFLLLTFTVVSGLTLSFTSDTPFSFTIVAGVFSWVFLGVVSCLRLLFHWKGRKSAMATVYSFSITSVVLLGYWFKSRVTL